MFSTYSNFTQLEEGRGETEVSDSATLQTHVFDHLIFNKGFEIQ